MRAQARMRFARRRIRAVAAAGDDRATPAHEFYPTTVNGGGKVACGEWLTGEGRMCKRTEDNPIHQRAGSPTPPAEEAE